MHNTEIKESNQIPGNSDPMRKEKILSKKISSRHITFSHSNILFFILEFLKVYLNKNIFKYNKMNILSFAYMHFYFWTTAILNAATRTWSVFILNSFL